MLGILKIFKKKSIGEVKIDNHIKTLSGEDWLHKDISHFNPYNPKDLMDVLGNIVKTDVKLKRLVAL